MILKRFQRLKRDHSQRHNHCRIHKRDCATQKVRAVSQFRRGWPAVRPRSRARIAKRGAGNEDIGTLEIYRSQKSLEISARLIAGKWHARTIGALASRRFANKHHARVDWPIQLA